MGGMAEPTAEAIGDVQAAFKADPAVAMCCYKAKSVLVEGLCTSLSFPNTPEHGPYPVDEPPMMPGGKDAGPNPMDLCLGALGTCQEIAYKAYATAMGIQLFKIETDIEGDCDLRGFLGVDPAVRAGFQAIRGTVKLYTTASEDQVKMLKGAVDAHCPMCATVTNKGGPEIALVKKETS